MPEARWWWATGLGLVALFLAFTFWDPAVSGGPDLCLFHRATGIACPACGLTRAAAALAKGHFAESWRWHPLLTVLAVEAAIFWLLWGRVQNANEPSAAFARQAPRVAIGTGVLLLLVWFLRWTTGTLPA